MFDFIAHNDKLDSIYILNKHKNEQFEIRLKLTSLIIYLLHNNYKINLFDAILKVHLYT